MKNSSFHDQIQTSGLLFTRMKLCLAIGIVHKREWEWEREWNGKLKLKFQFFLIKGIFDHESTKCTVSVCCCCCQGAKMDFLQTCHFCSILKSLVLNSLAYKSLVYKSLAYKNLAYKCLGYKSHISYKILLITSVSKKLGQSTKVYYYCALSQFF